MTALETLDVPSPMPIPAAARVAAMLEHPTLAVAVLRDGRILRANGNWNALFAWRSDVSVESHLITLFPNANSAERFERGLEAQLATRPARVGATARVEHMLVRRDGGAFMAEVVVHVVEAGSVAHPEGAEAVWQVRDITPERELRREIRELEEYYRALSTYQSDLTFVVDRKDCISFASASVETALGHRTNAILGEPFTTLLDAEGAVEAMRWLRAARDAEAMARGPGDRESFRLRVVHRDGRVRVLSCRRRNCLHVARIAGIVINARDVTEEVDDEAASRATHERAVRLRERLFDLATAPAQAFDHRIATLLAALCDGLATSSAAYWSAVAEGLQLQCDHSHVAEPFEEGEPRRGVRDPRGHRFDPAESAEYARELATNRPIVVDDIVRYPSIGDTPRRRLDAAGVAAFMDLPVPVDGRVVGVVSVNQGGGARAWRTEEIDFAAGIALLVALAVESGQREEAAARTTFMALHDGLTNLVNRTQAERDLTGRLQAAGARREGVAVAIIDLDLFKEVNDSHGHAMGDTLLVAVARALVEAAGPHALVARMGGDEFLVAFTETTAGATDSLVQRILDRIGGEPLVPAIEQQVGASIGVARYPADGADAETLLRHADIAMYEAKSRGRSQAFAFNGRLAERTRLARELDVEIADAIARNEFCLFYQPQLDFASGAAIGLEALLRWQHPQRGLLLPDAFMGAALHRGLIDTITKWVVGQVCEQIASWRRAGTPDLPVSVNVTGRQFHDRRLPAIVAGALMKSGLPARLLILEVTEESLMGDDIATERVVKELSRLGVRIAIGDFGVGYATLDKMRRLLVSQIKLDRGFISALPTDPDSGMMVAALVEMARRLKYQVIAEGVETREQLDHLRAAGCTAGQGYYFGAPLSAAEIRGFLDAKVAR